jgi:FtsZ-binding cell division protein ZapB
LRWDYALQEQAKINQKLADRFPPTEKTVALLQREIEGLWKIHEQLGTQQLQEAQHLLDTIGKALEARPKAEA